MGKSGKLKLNMILLEEKEMSHILGGYKCGCGCAEINNKTNASQALNGVYNKPPTESPPPGPGCNYMGNG